MSTMHVHVHGHRGRRRLFPLAVTPNQRLSQILGAQIHYLVPSTSRPYFFKISLRRSCGRAMTLWPSIPVIVSAAINALTIASSVACTVASNREFILSLGSMESVTSPEGFEASGLAVEK